MCTDIVEGRMGDMEMNTDEGVEMGSVSHGVVRMLRGEKEEKEGIVSEVSGEKEKMVRKGTENMDEEWSVRGKEVEKGENEMLWERGSRN